MGNENNKYVDENVAWCRNTFQKVYKKGMSYINKDATLKLVVLVRIKFLPTKQFFRKDLRLIEKNYHQFHYSKCYLRKTPF